MNLEEAVDPVAHIASVAAPGHDNVRRVRDPKGFRGSRSGGKP
jgi:hypothetical protein